MNFIVFSDDWGRHPSSCEHLIRGLLPEHKIIWVNTIGYRRPSLSYYDVKRSLAKIFSWFGPAAGHSGNEWPANLLVVSPVIIPYNNIRFIRRFNRIMVRKAIAKSLAKMRIEIYVLLSSLPNVSEFYRDHPNSLKIYYCVDDFTQFPGVDKQMITEMERELIDSCDLILYTAGYLEKKFSSSKKKIHYFPHGVDFDHFDRINTNKETAVGRKPVIGFFGYLSQWIDLDLIAKIAETRPDWEIVLIGGTDRNMDCLKRFNNVSLTGAVKYDRLPALASNFDVGIIPFKINELTRAVNPLKFLEYMAMGIPAVSTPLPELVRFGDHIYLADDHRDFIAKIERALKEDDSDRRKRRVELAGENSWAFRSKELIGMIESINKYPR